MKSHSASSEQPVLNHSLYVMDEYQSVSGKPAISVRLSMREQARFYAEHPKSSGYYESDWDSIYYAEDDEGGRMMGLVHNAYDALQAVRNFRLPLAIRSEALRASRELTHIFANVASLTVITDLVSGRLDRRKLPRVAETTLAGTFRLEEVRPYRKILPSPSKQPIVAIIASAGNGEMWNDSSYIPRVLKLTLSLLWACEAAGLQSYAALVEGHAYLHGKYKEAIFGHMLATPNESVALPAYAASFHRDLWRHGCMCAAMADYDGNQKLQALQGNYPGTINYGGDWLSWSGGNAIHWAQEILKPDLIISIGQNEDRQKADIVLESKFTIQQAVKEIAGQAKKLKRVV